MSIIIVLAIRISYRRCAACIPLAAYNRRLCTLQAAARSIEPYNEGVDTTPIDGASLEAAVRTFSPEMMQILADTNRILNGFIGLAILLVLILLFLHTIRWAVYGSRSTQGRLALAGALRAFIALFFMIDIWALIRVVQLVVHISPAVAYALVIVGAVLLFSWSLLGIGSLLIDSLIRGVHVFVDFSILHIRAIKHTSRAVKFLQKRTDAGLRFLVLFTMIVGVTAMSMFWQFTGTVNPPHPLEKKNLYSESQEAVAEALVHEDGDAEVIGTNYHNYRYGVSVTFPDGWDVYMSTSTNTLAFAWSKDGTLYSQLNAGSFADTPGSSQDDYNRTFWRVQRNVHLNYAQESSGILQTTIERSRDFNGWASSMMRIVSYWPYNDGSNGLVFDDYLVFGHGPVYYTLQFKYWNSASMDEVDEAKQETIDSIVLQ